jgi:pimeloyl-ACP methyl ester carboxylesterase
MERRFRTCGRIRPVTDLQPRLSVLTGSASVRSVAVVLHGGRAKSFAPAGPRQLTALRMRPFARALHRAGGGLGLAVWSLGYRYRGWNGADTSPVPDAEWALEQVRKRHGEVPVVLVGHSMGGRTALRVAGDPLVRAVAALAPWLPEGEPVDQVAGRRLLFVHGTADRVTDPVLSRAFADRARQVTEDVTYRSIPGENHAMLRNPSLWHRLTTDFVMDTLGRNSNQASA